MGKIGCSILQGDLPRNTKGYLLDTFPRDGGGGGMISGFDLLTDVFEIRG